MKFNTVKCPLLLENDSISVKIESFEQVSYYARFLKAQIDQKIPFLIIFFDLYKKIQPEYSGINKSDSLMNVKKSL